jgi:hypothetical protein
MGKPANFIIGSDFYLLTQVARGYSYGGFGDLPYRPRYHAGNQSGNQNK